MQNAWRKVRLQNILNKDGLLNQENVGSDKNFFNMSGQVGIKEGRVASRREKENVKFLRILHTILDENESFFN